MCLGMSGCRGITVLVLGWLCGLSLISRALWFSLISRALWSLSSPRLPGPSHLISCRCLSGLRIAVTAADCLGLSCLYLVHMLVFCFSQCSSGSVYTWWLLDLLCVQRGPFHPQVFDERPGFPVGPTVEFSFGPGGPAH